MEVWFEVVGDPIPGPGQRDASHEQDEEHHVGECRREVHDLHNDEMFSSHLRFVSSVITNIRTGLSLAVPTLWNMLPSCSKYSQIPPSFKVPL